MKIGDSIIEKLRSIVGAENVLTDGESRAAYSLDTTHYIGEADAVVRPAGTEEVAGVISLAYENAIPVTPRGAGTGLHGGAVPLFGGIVVSTERMNASPRVHKEDLYADVAAGVVTGEFHRLVESMGLFYPPDPSSLAACTIGGNIAECAGGMRGLKYGTTRRYVLGLELVTPEGGVIWAGARTVKSVAGYDVTRLMVGSEGTLGFITSAALRLLPLPQSRQALAAGFAEIAPACEAAGRLVGDGLLPSTLEIMDGVCTGVVRNYIGWDMAGDVLLLVEYDGVASVCADNAGCAAEILRREFKVDVRAGMQPDERESLWAARRAVLPALMQLSPAVLLEDLTVPRSKLPAMAEQIRRTAAKHRVQVAVFGHAGEGNLHPAFLTDREDSESGARARSAISEMTQACIDLEGTVWSEHGIGIDREPFLKLQTSQSGYDVMKALKGSLDPKGIMNPGKIFAEE